MSTPLYPVDYQGNPQRISITIPSTSGMINGTEYKYTIEISDGTIYVTTPEEPFSAVATPILTINSPVSLSTKTHEFVGTYTQSNGVQVKYFTWTLTNLTTGQIVHSPQKIYSQDIRFIYDGFLSNNHYSIHLIVVDQNNTTLEQESVFEVVYETEPITNFLTVTENTSKSSVDVIWNPTIITGMPNGQYEFIADFPTQGSTSLRLAKSSSVIFSKQNELALKFSSNNIHVVKTHVKPTTDKNVFYSASGVNNGIPYFIEVFTKTHAIYININNELEHMLCRQTSYEDDIVIVISPSSVYIKTIRKTGGLYPSNDLYPSNTLYPRDDTILTTEEFSFSINISPTVIFNQIAIYGEQTIDYIWITSVSKTTFEQPEWDKNTVFLATFDGDFEAGNVNIKIDNFYGWNVYREDIELGTLSLVQFVDINAMGVTDYFIPNKGQYRYYAYPIGDKIIGLPLVSDIINVNRDEWTLITSQEISNIQTELNFSKAYRFFIDLNVSDIGNNNQPNILAGFSSLPKIQVPNHNYLSGQLTSMIGDLDAMCEKFNGASSKELSKTLYNEIFGLSTDRKRKFLKDSIGNVFEVSTSAPIHQQAEEGMNGGFFNTTLPWVKIGEISGISMSEAVLPNEF